MRYKYPKTLHVPGSPGLARDLVEGPRGTVRDQCHMNFDSFKNREVIQSGSINCFAKSIYCSSLAFKPKDK